MTSNKRLRAALLALLIAILCLYPAACMAEGEEDAPYVVTIYNERNGLPTGEANTVIQSRDGYVWIGSYGGLIRYDGSTFRNYSMEGSFESSSVRALFEDSMGRLWIGTNDAGAFYMENHEIHAVKNPDPNNYLCVRNFAEGADGVIYIASNSGMAEIRDGELIPYSGEHLNGETVYSVAVDSRGRVWGALNSGICTVVENGELKRVYNSDELFEGEDIYCTAADSEGAIYIGSSGSSLLRLTFPGEGLEPEDLEMMRFTTDGVTTHNSIIAASDGRLIVCGNVGACVMYPDGEQLTLNERDGASAVNSAWIDYENNIWLASTNFGIIKYTRGCFKSPNAVAGLDNIAINAIIHQGDRYYLATSSGMLIFDDAWQPVENDLTQLYAGVRVRCLMADSLDRVWIAAYDNQNPVICYDPAQDSITAFNAEDGLVNTSARTLLELSDGSIAVGSQGGLNIIRDGRVVQSISAEDGLKVNPVLSLLETPEGTILAGSDGGGIYEIDGDTVIPHSVDEGLTDGVVLRMLRDEEGGGYFISAGSSLYYWDDGGFRLISDIRKGAGSIFDFYLRDEKLWILQNNGVFAFDRAALLAGENPLPQEYSFEHGLSGSIDANTWHWLSEDGTLYIATRSGVSIFDFQPLSNPVAMGIINQASVDGKLYEQPSSLRLGMQDSRLTIDFAALSFTDTSDIGISYCLDGFDSKETVITGEKSGSISYTNLPGGNYTFHMKVFGLQNPRDFNEYTLTIAKERRLREQPLFLGMMLLAVVLFVIAIAALINHVKLRSIRKRQREYRSIIEQSLQTFARTIDAKDRYTNGHSLRVAVYSRELARRMGKSEEEQENIYYIALLHDIGKIGVPDSILNKPGKLTPEEMDIIRRHPQIGGAVLRNFTALPGIADGAKYHHERYDGNGYCQGLAGEEIPEVARIIGVADAFDAMSNNRCYRQGLPMDTIRQEFCRCSGSQFDPAIVPFILEMIDDGFKPDDPSGSQDADEA